MHDTLLTLTVVAILAVICLGAYLTRRRSLHRLSDYLPELPDTYRIFIGLPLTLPSAWAEIVREEQGILITAGGGRYPLRSVRAFMVTRPTGEVVDAAHPFLPWPSHVKFPDLVVESGQRGN